MSFAKKTYTLSPIKISYANNKYQAANNKIQILARQIYIITDIKLHLVLKKYFFK